MKRPVRLSAVALAVVFATFGACEKSAKVDDKVTADDVALMTKLPKNVLVVFGGNFLKIQQGVNPRLTKMFGDANTQMWMTCFLDVNQLHMMAGAALGTEGVNLLFVFRGLGVPEIKGCADKAKFPVTVDPDGKYVTVELTNPQVGAFKASYLALTDGTLYTRQTMKIGLVPTVSTLTRADLEADIAGLSAGTAADNAMLQAIVAKADRSRTMWFAGDLSTTPAGSKLGELYGAMDGSGGLALDVTAQVKDPMLAAQVTAGLDELRNRAAQQQDTETKALLDAVQVLKTDDRLRARVRLSSAQLDALLNKIPGFSSGPR
ncbi:MAG: hypothetical protein AB7O24_10310 [Kofleriaceae bacterium]